MKLSSAPRKWSSTLAVALLLVASVGIIADLSTHADSYQRDLQTYYFAGKAYAAGLNPYDINVLSKLAQTRVEHRFVYPPATLPLFRLFAGVDFDTAYYLFLVIKGIALVGLFYLWKREFLPEMDVYFILFCLLAYNAAVYVDLRVGNISIFEQLVIWLAFLFYVRNRVFMFSLLVVIAASFKLAPVLFLLLLLWSKNQRRYLSLAGSVMLFLTIQLASYYVDRDLYSGFLRSLGGLDERGVINPSTLALVRDAFDWLVNTSGMMIPQAIGLAVFIAVAAGIGLATWRSYALLESADWPNKDRVAIFLACLAYALILPRFKTYSYVIVLVPTYFMLFTLGHATSHVLPIGYARKYGLMITVTILSSLYVVSLGSELIMKSVLSYSALFIAYSVWVLYLRRIFSLPQKQGALGPIIGG